MLWYEGRKDSRALLKARMGLKSNWEKCECFSGEAAGWGDPMSMGGVPGRTRGDCVRIGGEPLRKEADRYELPPV